MKKRKNKGTSALNEKNMRLIFKVILIALTFTLYYNTIFNHFSLDDHYININNPQTVKGIAGIPEIFSTLYYDKDNDNQTYGYRPIVRSSFALEYQFTANNNWNPYISHFINILLYIIAVLLLYKVLKRLLAGYNIWFPFFITILFLAHPTHTEVVASLKNRDVLLNFIFSFIAIWYFIKWIDVNKIKYLIFGVVSFIFALLSKETAIAQLAIFPLVIYFFTDVRIKKLSIFTLIVISIVILVFIARIVFLPEVVRDIKLWENPLVGTNNFMLHVSTVFYILGFYLKMLFIPFPLLYYYGYNMIPIVGWSDPWVLISLITNVALLIYALVNLKEKTILSFAILYFFINISMYANIVAPVPGIVADRFVFFATISMAIFIVWLLFRIFGIPLLKSKKNNARIIWVCLLMLLIIVPSGNYVRIRNLQWRTQYSLYNADMPKLWNSVKANNLFAHELMKKVNHELSKPVNPYKFIIGLINNAEKHYKQALHLDSTLASSWNNLGIIYSKIHGNQAKLRVQSHVKFNKPEKAELEKINSKNYFNTAIGYFHKAIHFKPQYGSALFNMANAYELQNQYDSSIVYFHKAVEADGGKLVSMSRLANAYYLNNQPEEAVNQNKKIILAYPESDMPYINLGNYASNTKDTVNALINYKEAFELGSNPEVGKLLSRYYESIGDNKKAYYYFSKSKEAEQLNKKKKN